MHFHNDDMDELFRRAAEDYPLNTRSADWEKMHALLIANEAPQHKESKLRALWLLLLLPVVFICSPLMDGMIKPGAPVTFNVSPADNRHELLQPAERKEEKELQTSNIQLKAKTAVPAESLSAQHRSSEQKTVEKGLEGFTSINADLSRTVGVEENISQPVQQQDDHTQIENVILLTSALRQFEQEEFRSETPAPVIGLNSKSNVVFAATMAADSGGTATPRAGKQRRFYAGVVAGPDLSTVQFEKFSRVGFQAGIVLGYQLDGRLAIEAAALSSRKYYYSEGEYVRSAKVYRPAYAQLLSADGNCRMLELPVSLQYTFSSKPKHTWFASAGISSYLMKKEDYTYDYLYLNSGNLVSYRKVYENQTRNLFSVLQFSAGYTLQLGPGSNLRVEPYYSLPLKGIGYGELPLSSIGLRVGITSKRF